MASTRALRVTMLGSGSPSPSLTRCHPAALVEWGDTGRILVDAGAGVVGQVLRAGVPLRSIERVAITHLHWDHVLGYPAFVWGSWSAGRQALTVWGPAGTRDMHERLVAEFYGDQAAWAIDLGYPAAGWHGTSVADIAPGWTTNVDGCRIDAGAVVHPPMAAVAYRFTYCGRSLVISGDTAACDELIQFSAGADLLVVDACASEPPADATPARQGLIRRLVEFHASPQQCVDMASQAGVQRVVLTHHLPEARFDGLDSSTYPGEVLIGADLDTYVA